MLINIEQQLAIQSPYFIQVSSPEVPKVPKGYQ